MTVKSPGKLLRDAVQQEKPLQLVGCVNAYFSLLAKLAGFNAIYLSGAGVANASYGLPDLGMTSLRDVLEDVRRVTDVNDLPLLVDADTGWGDAFGIARTVKQMIKAGAAGIHIEDQVANKRCGHRPNKQIVSQQEMVDRIKAAADAKTDPNFVIMARTDAVATEGMQHGIERALACVEAGADMIFPEALTTLEEFEQFSKAVKMPILANMTEFGVTPLFSTQELAQAGVQLALYPQTIFRTISQAANELLQGLRKQGTQAAFVEKMQTREELYQCLNYHAFEQQLDRLYSKDKE